MWCHTAASHSTSLLRCHQLCLSASADGDAVRFPAASSRVDFSPGKNRNLDVLVDRHSFFHWSHVHSLHLPHTVQQTLHFQDPFVSFRNLGLGSPEASLRFLQPPDVLVELGLGRERKFDLEVLVCGPSKHPDNVVPWTTHSVLHIATWAGVLTCSFSISSLCFCRSSSSFSS